MQIYIVIGNTGSYEDYHTWISKCFTNKQLAESFKSECQNYASELKIMYNTDPDKFWANEFELLKNSPDEFMRMDYTGTDYDIQEHELVTDEFLEQLLQIKE